MFSYHGFLVWSNQHPIYGWNRLLLIAPVTFEGGCKRDTVENWLHTLGQSLPKDELDSYPQRFLIMDNARFHRGGDLKQIAEKYNLTLLYLPPYSPELNPVERFMIVLNTVQFNLGFTIYW